MFGFGVVLGDGRSRLDRQELGEAAVLSHSRVSRIVEEFVAAGLAERCPNPDDRRSSYALITAEGRKVLRRAAPVYLRRCGSTSWPTSRRTSWQPCGPPWSRCSPAEETGRRQISPFGRVGAAPKHCHSLATRAGREATPAPANPFGVPRPQRLVDFQFLAMAAAGLVIVTREILPVLLLTVVIALVMLAYEAGARRYCRRIDFGGASTDDVSGPLSDADLSRWKSVIDRTLRSND